MRIADGPVVLVSSPTCHQVAVPGSHMRSAVRRNSPLHHQGFVFGPRGCSSRAPHSPICRHRGVLSGPREGESLISTRLSAPKVTHPDQGGATPSPEDPTGRSTSSPHSFMGCRSRTASLPARRDGRSSRTDASHLTGCRRTQRPPFPSVARCSPHFVLCRGFIPGWP